MSELTGYPSIDKPWLKYYNEQELASPLPDGSMYEYLWDCNKDHLNDTALVYFGRKITYAMLFRQINLIASALTTRGIQAGDVVSIISLNTPETIYTYYALNKIGAVVCMEYITQTAESLCNSLESVKTKKVFILDIFLPTFEKALLQSGIEEIIIFSLSASMGYPLKLVATLKRLKLPEAGCFIPFRTFLKNGNSAEVETVHGGKAAAVMLSTSGTTGIPKKVVHSSYNINSIVFQYQTSGMGFNRGETYISMAPLFLSFGITLAIHLPLCVGVVSIICLDVDAKKTIAMFAKYKPNYFLCGDYHMLEMISNATIEKMKLSFLRIVAIGGVSLSTENVNIVNKFLREHGSLVGLITGYGMTELGATCVTEMNCARRVGSVGIPQNRVIVKIIDTETGKEKTYGELGEILIHAPSVMMEYWNNPQETAHTLETDEQGRKWVHTGDLGHIDADGFLYIQGRIKRIARRIWDGVIYKIFPDFIEKTLSEHSSVKHSAVICIEHKTEITVPIAFVVLTEQIEEPAAVLSKYIQEKAGDYDVPAKFVFMTELPLLSNGKIDYHALEKEMKNSANREEVY